MSMKSLVVPIFGVMVAVSAMPALAQYSAERPTRVVKVKPQELMTEAGRTRIEIRIYRAAEAVCSINNGRLPLIGHAFDACRDQAMADARRQLAVRVAAATGRTELADNAVR